jgi:hypothetical protein
MPRFVLALSLVLCACSSDSPSPAPDASGPAPGTFGAACTTVSDTSSECMGKPCSNSFDTLGHNACSQSCTLLMQSDPSCPIGADGTKKCNIKGYCKP